MKKTIIIITVIVGILTALIWGIGTYQINKTKQIIHEIVNIKGCVINKTFKQDTKLITKDGQKIYFIRGLLQCEQGEKLLIEMQYVENRAREKQGLKITKSTGEYDKSGIWYR